MRFENCDVALVHSAQRGDPAAVNELLSEMRLPVRAYCSRRLPRQARADTDDVVQEVLISVAHALPHGGTFETVDRFFAFATTIAHRRVVDVYRRLKPEELTDQEPAGHHADSTDRVVLGGVDLSVVGDAASVLNAAQRTVVVLRAQGLAHREIAARVGCTPGSSRVLYHRAIRALRAYVLTGGPPKRAPRPKRAVRPPGPVVEAMRRAYEDGASLRVVGLMFGLSAKRTAMVLRESGCQIRQVGPFKKVAAPLEVAA